MMDTFAVLVSKTARYSVRKDAEFKTWLFAVARNQARNHLRRRKRFFDMTDDALESQPDDFQNQPEYVILREEKNQKLWQALKAINSDYRQVLYLMYFESYNKLNRNYRQYMRHE
jgi:RNA polymerase sigma-70 factor (ECF subfamily)